MRKGARTSIRFGKSFHTFVALCFALSLGACGLSAEQKKAATTFSASADAFGKLAGDEFTAIQAGSSELILTTYTQDPQAQWPRGDVNYDRLLFGKLTAKQLALRQQAAKTLSDYGQALSALVTANQSDELQTASTALATSLKSLPASLKVVSDDDIDLVGKLVEQAGAVAVEQVKADALRTIVPKYQRQVERLCRLLGTDLDPAGGAFASEYNALASRLYRHAAGALDSGLKKLDQDNPPDKATRAFELRAKWLPIVQLANEHNKKIGTLVDAASAGQKCAEANAALVKALSETNYSFKDIEAFAKQVQTVYATVKSWK